MQPHAERIEALFAETLALSSPSVRAAYLDERCGNDPELRAEVESLLAAHDAAGDLLEPLDLGTARIPATDEPIPESSDLSNHIDAQALSERDEWLGAMIGPYKLIRLLGEGGMGLVYMAEQAVPVRRMVALKILKPGMDTRRIVARFEAERQALAMMEHPNIARVLDAGATDSGRPYFVMELVRGMPITAYCDQHHLALEARLKLFGEVCRAVQHAHQKGIIHRDLKPANILVTLHDGVLVPKVIDFGIAKAIYQPLTDKTLDTAGKQFMGTPQYMSPEQASMNGIDVDTRSNIYALGVVLYELLTSQTPLDTQTLQSSTHHDLPRLIRDIDPPTPSTRLNTLGNEIHQVARNRQADIKALGKLVRGDLDRIVMKALEKNRTRRYDTALELAQDVEHHLRHEPILAGSPTLADRWRKFTRRHRAGVMAGAAASAALLVGVVLATGGWLHARQQTQLARQAQHEAQIQAARSQSISHFLQDILVSVNPQQAAGMNVDIEQALASARAVFGDDHAAVAATMTSLAARLENDGDFKAAEALLMASLGIWERVQGKANANYLTTLTLLGKVQSGRESDRAAEQTFREVIRLSQPSRMPDGMIPALADARDGLARIVAARGDYDEAATLLREALHIQQAAASGQRFVRIERLERLRRVLVDGGRDHEAEAVWREQHHLAGLLYPAGSLRLAELNVAFAHFLGARGQAGEAEKRVRDAIAIYEARPARPLAPLIQAQRFLYELLVSRSGGLQHRAEALRRQIDDNARRLWGERDLRLADMRFDFAQVAYRRGQPGVAIDQAIDALRIYRGHSGAFDPKPLVRLIRWSVLMANRGGYPHDVYKAAVRGARVVVNSEPEEGRAHMILGIAQFRAGHYDQARNTLVEADRRYSGPSGGAPPTLAFLAMSHHALGDTVQAKQVLARAQALMQDPRWAGDADEQGVVDEALTFLATHENPHTPDHSHGCPAGT
ncbi:serine/threonine-protein kinase [Candidatus Entotheonella palauensis]|uniref:serine/threonine-protein kinase n=1 Tax=Candidatus Entotheonella palauensis TaxID=93172 RepID=UPI000B7D6076|nr:serine/threonine-protein kinase [Candidatus Entotheonella palauensis]